MQNYKKYEFIFYYMYEVNSSHTIKIKTNTGSVSVEEGSEVVDSENNIRKVSKISELGENYKIEFEEYKYGNVTAKQLAQHIQKDWWVTRPKGI